MKQKTNSFRALIKEVHTLKEYHNPLPLFEDLHMDSLDGEYQFTTSIKSLHLVSRAIENTLKIHKNKCVLYAGFQLLSHFSEYLDNYAQLANYAKEIFIIGVADRKIGHIADNVHIMTKNAYAVRDNWIAIVDCDDIHITLIAEERPLTADHRYDGFYSNSGVVTKKAIKILNENKVLAKEVEYGEQISLF
mgnify:CR=1 FL=1